MGIILLIGRTLNFCKENFETKALAQRDYRDDNNILLQPFAVGGCAGDGSL